MSSKQILIVSPMRKNGGSGVQTYANTLHNYLVEKGIVSSIITPYSSTFFLVYPIFIVQKMLHIFSSEWSISWSRYWRYFFLRHELRKTLKAQAKRGIKTVVYAQCPVSAKAALDSRENCGQRIFMIVHYNISQADEWIGKGKIKSGGPLDRRIRSLECEVVSRVDGIVYVSKFMKGVIEENLLLSKQAKTVFLPCFTNASAIQSRNGKQRDLITIGSLEARKNQSYLIQVLACAKQKGFSYSLTIVGDGDQRKSLEKLAQQLGLNDQVYFTGYLKDAASKLSGHRLYVHSAVIENLPISLLEALSNRLPIIAGAVGGIPEIFDNGVEGYYWPLDNVEQASDILIDVMENEDKYQRLVKATVARFTNKFQTETVANRLVEFLFN